MQIVALDRHARGEARNSNNYCTLPRLGKSYHKNLLFGYLFNSWHQHTWRWVLLKVFVFA